MIQPELVRELQDIHSTLPLDAGDFTCVYGSSLYHPTKVTSDVDLFVVSDAPALKEPATVDGIVDTIKGLHVRYGRKIDEEVPFANKLVYRHGDLEDATRLRCFEIDSTSGNITIPAVEKTDAFLNGRGIKLRLALNALTTPHLVIAEDPSAYEEHKAAAETAMVAAGIATHAGSDFRAEDIFDALTVGPDNSTGEMYLGYKIEHPAVKVHLEGVITRTLGLMAAGAVIRETMHGFSLPTDVPPIALLNTALPDNN